MATVQNANFIQYGRRAGTNRFSQMKRGKRNMLKLFFSSVQLFGFFSLFLDLWGSVFSAMGSSKKYISMMHVMSTNLILTRTLILIIMIT